MAPPKKSTSSKPKQPTKIKRVKEVLFDEDARKEYLTGFSKRKKQRELAVRVKAIDKEREEKNESRRQVRDERKERAATNVRNAKALYGDEEDGLSESDSGSSILDSASEGELDNGDAGPELGLPKKKKIKKPPSSTTTTTGPLQKTSAYESIDLVTTVSIEPFSLSRSPSPDYRHNEEKEGGGGGERKEFPLDMKGNPIYPESNNNHNNKSGRVSGSLGTAKKRVKNKAAFRPKMTRSDKKARATGGKKQKAGFLKGNSGTKGKSNRD